MSKTIQDETNRTLLLEIEEKIDRANISSDQEELLILSKSPYLNIRRAVAKNKYVLSDIINELAHDITVNVSIVALKHPNCTVNREFDTYSLNHKCVICSKSEKQALYECNKCSL